VRLFSAVTTPSPYTTLFRSHQGNRSNCGNHKHDLECFTSTFQMQAHKHQIAHQINDPAANAKQGFAISANETGNCCRSNSILNQDRKSTRLNSSHVSNSYAV